MEEAPHLGDDLFRQRVYNNGPMNETDRKIKLYGTRGSSVAYSIRDFLQRSDVPFQWIEVTSDEGARVGANVSGLGDDRLPVCVFDDGCGYRKPRPD